MAVYLMDPLALVTETSGKDDRDEAPVVTDRGIMIFVQLPVDSPPVDCLFATTWTNPTRSSSHRVFSSLSYFNLIMTDHVEKETKKKNRNEEKEEEKL